MDLPDIMCPMFLVTLKAELKGNLFQCNQPSSKTLSWGRVSKKVNDHIGGNRKVRKAFINTSGK